MEKKIVDLDHNCHNVEWENEPVATYTLICQDPGGDYPATGFMRVGLGSDYNWYVDDGDETVRALTYGPYLTREVAVENAEAIALEKDS